jgi:hypothetical protein
LLVKVLVYNLSLAISLRVEYSRELNLNPKDIVEFILEVRYKLGTIVRDNWFRSAIELIDIINVKASYILYSYSLKVKEGDELLI